MQCNSLQSLFLISNFTSFHASHFKQAAENVYTFMGWMKMKVILVLGLFLELMDYLLVQILYFACCEAFIRNKIMLKIFKATVNNKSSIHTFIPIQFNSEFTSSLFICLFFIPLLPSNYKFHQHQQQTERELSHTLFFTQLAVKGIMLKSSGSWNWCWHILFSLYFLSFSLSFTVFVGM